jgi:hypothetical protein
MYILLEMRLKENLRDNERDPQRWRIIRALIHTPK